MCLAGSGIVRPVTYSLVSALVGTQSVLQSKCFAELVKSTLNGDNQFNKVFVYVVILNFICGLSFWLYRMNAALKMFDGLIIIPLLQVFWTTCAILQGGVFFKEFSKFTPLQSTCFLLGVIIVFIGVFLLTPQPREGQGGGIEGRSLLPTDSESSLVGRDDASDSDASSNAGGSGGRNSGPSVPAAFTTSSKNSLLHGLHPNTFSNSGLSFASTHDHGQGHYPPPSSSSPLSQYENNDRRGSDPDTSTTMGMSMHALFSITSLPVVVERLEPRVRRLKGMSSQLGDIEVPRTVRSPME
jgi:hypothetical protein